MRNYYEILGVPEEAGHYEIKAAFKRLAMQYHPDKHAGDPAMEERFKEINMAYQVLSDPIEKANYDYRFKYSVPTYDYTPPPPQYPPRRPPFARPANGPIYTEEDLRQNNRGTLWAFGLAFALATIIMSAMQGYNYYENYKLEALLGERRAIFDSAMHEAAAGHFNESLQILTPFVSFYKEEADVREFKETLISDIIRNGDLLYESENYQAALENYLLAKPYLVYRTFDFNRKVVHCYRATGQFEQAIDAYNDLATTGFEKRSTLKTIAEIYRDDLKDYDESLNYFHKAANNAVENYIATFGQAYIILINGGNIPEDDLYIFLGEAQGYLLVGDVEQSLHETKWMADVWPKRPEIFLLRAECYRAVGNEQVACEYINLAARLGPLPEGVEACR